MPCLAISASTTAYGRTMIMRTREIVQDKYRKSNGYEEDCEVIYGDTDSVMVNFRVRGLPWSGVVHLILTTEFATSACSDFNIPTSIFTKSLKVMVSL